MHIMIDAQPFLRREDGIGRYCKELFTELVACTDHTYELVGFRDQKELPRLLPESDQVSYTFLPFPRRLYSLALKNIYAIPVNRWLSKTPDAAIYPNFVNTPRLHGVPSFLIVHDVAFIDRPETVNKRNLRYLEQMVPSAIAKATKVLTISEFSARRLGELFQLNVEDIGLLQPGINTNHFNGTYSTRILKKHGLQKGYILAVGTIEPRKNHDKLLDAYLSLDSKIRKKHQLVLAGRPGWRTESLVERIEALKKAGEGIVITGFFDDEDLPSLYAHAAVFVQASTYEGFGIPPLEAMVCETPVVTSNLSALEEAVGDAVEIIDPNDATSIAEGIEKVLSDPDRQAELIKRGNKQAKKFTWSKSAKNLARILESNV